jgi:hypothetical protein
MQVVLLLVFSGTSKLGDRCMITLQKTIDMPCVPHIGQSVIVNGDAVIEKISGVGRRTVVDVSWFEDSPNQFEVLLGESVDSEGLDLTETEWFVQHMKVAGWTTEDDEWAA